MACGGSVGVFAANELSLTELEAFGSIIVYRGTREDPSSACVVGRPLALADVFKDVVTTRHHWVHNDGVLLKSNLFNHIWRYAFGWLWKLVCLATPLVRTRERGSAF